MLPGWVNPLASPPYTAPPPQPASSFPTILVVLLGLFLILPFLFGFLMFLMMAGMGGSMHGGWGWDMDHMEFDFPFLFPFFGFGFFALVWVISLLLAIWVYKDAEERNMMGILWGVVVFFAPLIGLVVYLVIRDNPPRGLLKNPPPYAPGAEPPQGAPAFWSPPPQHAPPQYAPPPPTAAAAAGACPSCGTPTPAGARFCPSCGARVA